jgi:two-component system, response regulator / RNA-binding antiterminator
MALAFLRDLRDLNVIALHPDNSEGDFLVDHLRRIGCKVFRSWPVPEVLPLGIDVVFLAMEHEARVDIERFIQELPEPSPTMLAIVGYENPSALQMVLESGALAVVERPIKPFGLLTNLAIARSVWLDRQAYMKEARKYRRRVLGDQRLARAKAIIMVQKSCTEAEAYNVLRQRAMADRIAIEEVAQAVIDAERPPHD